MIRMMLLHAFEISCGMFCLPLIASCMRLNKTTALPIMNNAVSINILLISWFIYRHKKTQNICRSLEIQFLILCNLARPYFQLLFKQWQYRNRLKMKMAWQYAIKPICAASTKIILRLQKWSRCHANAAFPYAHRPTT